MFRTTLAAFAIAALGAGSAAAQDGRFFAHVGPGQLAPDEDAVISTPAGVFPGANVSLDSSLTAAVEVGYFFSPTVSVSITGGLPPTEDVMGAGSLAAAGKLGELNYGPAAVMAQYRFAPMGAFQPYVGAGVAVMYVFGDDDAAATNLEVENAAGPALQVGAEYMLNERFGLFIDYKKAWFDTEGSGNLGAVPFTADIQVNPAFLHAGVAFRF
jgi:outer membrane protein